MRRYPVLLCDVHQHIGANSYKSIESILKNNLDQQPLPSRDQAEVVPDSHENIRGKTYFQ